LGVAVNAVQLLVLAQRVKNLAQALAFALDFAVEIIEFGSYSLSNAELAKSRATRVRIANIDSLS
jgi:hypothetical protein